MVAPDRLGRLMLLLLAVTPALGCPPKKPPETVARAAAAVERPAGERSAVVESVPDPNFPAPKAAEVAPQSPISDTVVVVSPGDPEAETTPNLGEAARLERERKAHAGKPMAVINDKTLSRYAKGQVTFAEPKPKISEAEKAELDDEAAKERFWRSKVLDVRIRWHDAAKDAEDLEKEAGDLRRRFYAEDDPFVRDGRLKPEWDRALDRLRLARETVAGARRELAELLEEGRRAGALPGWLREGIEHEPAFQEERPPRAEPGEPQILDEGQRHG